MVKLSLCNKCHMQHSNRDLLASAIFRFEMRHCAFLQMEGCDCILFTQLLEFLSQYQSAQRSQGRFPGKLGHVFGSIFLRAQEGPLPLASPEDVEIAASIVHLLIENQASIFTQPSAICKPAQRPPSRQLTLPLRKWMTE